MRIQLRDDTDDDARSKQRDAVLHQLEICLQNILMILIMCLVIFLMIS